MMSLNISMMANNTTIAYELPRFYVISSSTQNISLYSFILLFVVGFTGNMICSVCISNSIYLLTRVYELIYCGFHIEDPEMSIQIVLEFFVVFVILYPNKFDVYITMVSSCNIDGSFNRNDVSFQSQSLVHTTSSRLCYCNSLSILFFSLMCII